MDAQVPGMTNGKNEKNSEAKRRQTQFSYAVPAGAAAHP
jgi:hypothetical protein